MDRITELDKTTVRKIAERLDALCAADPELAAMGVTVKYAGGRYETLEATLKVKARITGAGGEAPEAARYRTQGHLLGVDAAWLGQDFSTAQGRYTLTGMLNRRSDACFTARAHRDGKSYLFKAEQLQFYFKQPLTAK